MKVSVPAPTVGSDSDFDLTDFDDPAPEPAQEPAPEPAQEPSPLRTSRFAGAQLELPGRPRAMAVPEPAFITGEFDPMADDPDGPSATGEFDPLAAPPRDRTLRFGGALAEQREAEQRLAEQRRLSAQRLAEQPFDEQVSGEFDPFSEPLPTEPLQTATDVAEFDPSADEVTTGEFDLSEDPDLLEREPDGRAVPAKSLDLAEFAAEMDQLAAELEAVVARRPSLPPARTPVPSRASARQSPLRPQPTGPMRVDLPPLRPVATGPQLDAAPGDQIDPFETTRPSRGFEEAFAPQEDPRALPAWRAAAHELPPEAPPGAWSGFDAAPPSFDDPPADTWPATTSSSRVGDDESAASLDALLTGLDEDLAAAQDSTAASAAAVPVTMPSLVEASRVDSPRITGTHEALDFGGDFGQSLDLDAPVPTGAHRAVDSGSQWTGPEIAGARGTGDHDPVLTGEYESPQTADPGRLSALRELLRTFDKTVRVYNLYEGKGKSAARALSSAHAELERVLGEFGDIPLRVTPYEFMLGTDAVYTSEEDRTGLTYRLFRDGVRELTLRRGTTETELAAVVDVMRVTTKMEGEDDSVTLLWQRSLEHVDYRAIDVFLEGMVADQGHMQVAIDELVQQATAPLHGRETIDGVTNRALQPLPDAVVEALSSGIDDAQLAEVQEALRGLEGDLWRRSMWLCLHMIEAGGAASSVVALLAQIFEEMLHKGRWEALAAASGAVRQIQDVAAGKGAAGRAAPLQAALARLCAGDRIAQLGELLEVAKPVDYDHIIGFFALLPQEGDQALLALLARVPPGALQDRFAGLLEQRGIDLTAYHRQRLRHTNATVVIMALRALAKLGSEQATEAIASMLAHSAWKVVLEAVIALDGRIEQATPALVGALLAESHQVRDRTLDLLEKLPAGPAPRLAGPAPGAPEALAPIVLEQEHERWTDKQLKRATQVLVTWGGDEIDDQLIKILTVSNPFRRRKLEDRRQQVFEAVQRVGGSRARVILAACLERKLPAPVREGMARVLARLETER